MIAITLRASPDTSEPIRALQQEATRFEDQPSTAVRDYPPHLTLAIYEADDETLIYSAGEAPFAGMAPLNLNPSFEGTLLTTRSLEPVVSSRESVARS